MHRTTTRVTALLGAAALALGLAACSSDEPAEAEGSADATEAATGGEWPRTVEHEAGSTELEAQPERIVSTSVTLTGGLLSVDAPVVASAATTPSEGLTDNNGFFAQWSDVAAEKGVEVAYPDLTLDLEAVIAAEPDLIVASATGADATADAYDQLADIAPTIVIDYSDKSWQDLTTILGEATGHEAEAEATLAEYDAYVADAAAQITVPEGDTQLVAYNGNGQDSAFGKPGGPHAEIVSALGFTVVGAPDELDTSEQAREDFAFLSFENTVESLTAPTVLLVNGTDETAESLTSEPLLANAPAVTEGVVEPLGPTSFRIDYYSALGIVDTLVEEFGA